MALPGLLLPSNFDVCMLARICPRMREYMRADAYVCLPICLTDWLTDCMYMCVCQNEGLIGTLRMLWNMSDKSGIEILEVCECPVSVADRQNGFVRVLRGKNRAKLDCHLHPWGLRVSRRRCRPMHWLGECRRSSKQSLARLAPESWKSASVQKLSQNSGMGWGGSVSVCARVCASVYMYLYMTVCEFPYS